MGAVQQWEGEKQALAAQLCAALAALVGDVQALRPTSAFLSWRTGTGIQGHWRAMQEHICLGRITPSATEGLVNEQLTLRLDSVGEEDTRTVLAYPVLYHSRTGAGVVTGYAPETPAIYAAALGLVTLLYAELGAMLAHLHQAEESHAPSPTR